MKDKRIRAGVLALLLWLPPGGGFWFARPQSSGLVYETHCNDGEWSGWEWWFQGCVFLP